MAWSSAFLAALTSRHLTPVWLLEVVRTPIAGEADVYTSHPSFCPDLIAGVPRANGTSIQPITWMPTYGTWSVVAQGDGARAVALLPRGAVVRLLAGFSGLDRDQMEPVAVGVVRRITGTPSGVTIECADLLSAMQQRWSDAVGHGDLFYAVAVSTALTSQYLAGNIALNLSSSTGFLRMSGGSGAVLVEPVTGYDPFYLTYTGISGNQLTGVSSTGKFGSTAVTGPIGSTVRNCAYLYGHPCDIVLRLLLSEGGTTDWDVLPTSWGFGLPEDLVDIEDIQDWRARLAVASGTYSWDLVTAEKQPAGLGWLQDYLSKAGIWLAMRMGRITIRSALDVEKTRDYEDAISEDDLAGAWAWEFPDSAFGREYREVRAQAGSTTYDIHGASVETLPTEDRLTYDLSDQVFDNATEICTETCRRLAPWATKLPEVITLPCRGWRLAGLCPGDPVRLDLPRLTGQLIGRSASYDSWPATVVSVSPDFSRHQTMVRVWPDREST